MSSDPRLAALPALRKRAEEEARERFEAVRASIRANNAVAAMGLEWENAAGFVRDAWTEAHLSLLSDLTRPASRRELTAMVAEAMGLECGATAPDLILAPSFCDGERTHSWLLVGPAGPAGFGRRWWSFHSEGEDPDGADGWTLVPGVSAVTDPTEALTLIAVSVLGGAS
jgi:hypothetical protein